MLDLGVFKRKALGSAAVLLTAFSKASTTSVIGLEAV